MLKLIVDFGTLLIGVEGAKTPAGGRGGETPQERSDEEAVSARGKRSAWNGNQQASLTEPLF